MRPTEKSGLESSWSEPHWKPAWPGDAADTGEDTGLDTIASASVVKRYVTGVVTEWESRDEDRCRSDSSGSARQPSATELICRLPRN